MFFLFNFFPLLAAAPADMSLVQASTNDVVAASHVGPVLQDGNAGSAGSGDSHGHNG
ncbi:hypothetical protein [Segniliparus rugosus]|uniref:Uncharacterized protein n=1 Tax=Segniliparus rugosus (strain ATCC BAA-974 / DSM 45345 / CCUG 50838 / CIP 108380 / JCM 13579 / CDC 945) TaxID=679197 RepID=U1LMF3_SEGRC|nr:hypothetical protein [Segniliparus rugosus]ERG69136.1 hypothetical protein HMPREF9336_04280 [Segniliparus rugosus ATCC BAA-974]